MNTKQIEYCLELSHTLNFSQAAKNLFTSQPSLTYQIKLLEDEVGFAIFERSAKGAILTPAGERFCSNLSRIRDDLRMSIEEGQNISSKYSESLNVCLPMRSCLYFLPQIMQQFETEFPHVSLNLKFIYDSSHVDSFLRGEQDILFSLESEIERFHSITFIPIFLSHLYIIARKDDPLANHSRLSVQDLAGRSFMVGGGSPPDMVIVQNRIVSSGQVRVLNSPNHETTLANVAAKRGIVLSPGFADDHNNEFAWIPFDCQEKISCGLAFHKNDKRDSTRQFIKITQDMYAHAHNINL